MRYLVLLMCLLSPFQARAAEWEEVPKLEAIFKDAAVTGTFVVYDVHSNKYIGCNKLRAEARFSPASTFKIANSLIGLSVGEVKSVDEIIPYKGPKEPFIKEWKKDMGLRDAILLSNVPIYQELARRIGVGRMDYHIKRANYGNKEIGSVVDEFWLNGPLKISALEQVRFLAALAKDELPFPAQHQDSVRDITLIERGENWKLHAKTGWENAPGRGVGWWVGWVEKDGRIYSFAINIDVEKETDAGKRIELGREGLEVLRILPASES